MRLRQQNKIRPASPTRAAAIALALAVSACGSTDDDGGSDDAGSGGGGDCNGTIGIMGAVIARHVGAQRIVAAHPDLSRYRVYLTGPEHAVPQTRALLLAHGLPAAQLHIDSFHRF